MAGKWKKRAGRRASGEGSWFGGVLRGVVLGALMLGVGLVTAVMLMPAPSTETALRPTGDGTEDAADREAEGRSGPRSSGSFTETAAVPDAAASVTRAPSVAAPSRAPGVAQPGAGAIAAPTGAGAESPAITIGATAGAPAGGGAPGAAPSGAALGGGAALPPTSLSPPGSAFDRPSRLPSGYDPGEQSQLAPAGAPTAVPGEQMTPEEARAALAALEAGEEAGQPAGGATAGTLAVDPLAVDPATLTPEQARAALAALEDGGAAGAAPATGANGIPADGPATLTTAGTRPALAAPEGGGGSGLGRGPVADPLTLDPETLSEAEARAALAALEASGGVASLPVPAATAESPSGGSLRGTDGAGATQPADAAADPLALDPATLSAEEARAALARLEAAEVQAPGGDVAGGEVAGSELAGGDVADVAAQEETAVLAAVRPVARPEPSAGTDAPVLERDDDGVLIEGRATGEVVVPAPRPAFSPALRLESGARAASTAPAAGVPAAPGGGDDEGAADLSALAALDGEAFTRNAASRAPEAGAATLAVVLVASAAPGAITPEMLATLDLPVALALPAGSDPDAAGAARRAGLEIVAEVDGGDPAAALASLPVAMAAMPAAGGSLSTELAGMLAEHGFGYLHPRALGSAGSLRRAEAAGVPATAADRSVEAGASEADVYNALQVAAGVARRQGRAVLLVPATPATLRAAMQWQLERGAGRVSLAPLSSVMRPR
ncbi:MAG: divergent polysaccharide deacetylase family protein [Pseudomonadota bacterium]